MQEQERAANEEVEKRLKAALLTKREPGTAASRIASPAIGTPTSEILADAKQPPDESSGTDEVLMEVDATSAPNIQSTDVSVFFNMKFLQPKFAFFRAPGCLSWKPCSTTSKKSHQATLMMSLGKPLANIPSIHSKAFQILLDLVSTSHFGSFQHMI